jgi:hypothetical protein
MQLFDEGVPIRRCDYEVTDETGLATDPNRSPPRPVGIAPMLVPQGPEVSTDSMSDKATLRSVRPSSMTRTCWSSMVYRIRVISQSKSTTHKMGQAASVHGFVGTGCAVANMDYSFTTSTRMASPAFTESRTRGSPSSLPNTFTAVTRRHSLPLEAGVRPNGMAND